jgi:hypothetical protein
MKNLSNIDIKEVKRIIEKDYPLININEIKTINNGRDNIVFEINNTYIFRFPKNEPTS